MSPELHGRDFRALRRLANGENETLAEMGDTCERIPPEHLPALLQSGDIERAVERRAAAEPTADQLLNRRKR